MHIVLSNSTSLPIYEQIKEQIKAQILSGELAEGEKLPSLRRLAADLKIRRPVHIMNWKQKVTLQANRARAFLS